MLRTNASTITKYINGCKFACGGCKCRIFYHPFCPRSKCDPMHLHHNKCIHKSGHRGLQDNDDERNMGMAWSQQPIHNHPLRASSIFLLLYFSKLFIITEIPFYGPNINYFALSIKAAYHAQIISQSAYGSCSKSCILQNHDCLRGAKYSISTNNILP